ncbi:hypothetical protein CMU89_00940 [Elizabethkingia anophelis]|nr:hypothetical protein [Elizabethkingia anophelis]MDV3541236.1 hypothetical protein [Elizabethkingia anophelis]PKR31602.1 hypothetical protein CWH99_12645 [Elizabethkingia anophelis]PKR33790.1 hypothetical protein CWI00_16745 [Elizabethkingia anophelis]PRQ78282.1 hypothetical protein CMT60_18670 [Elizabethkingia anophelis]
MHFLKSFEDGDTFQPSIGPNVFLLKIISVDVFRLIISGDLGNIYFKLSQSGICFFSLNI